MEHALYAGSTERNARSVNINGVVALLVEALKEDSQMRRQLEQRLAALESAKP
ncbi:hypothetical protein ACU62C_22810 [Klebsiella aerogenes]